MQRGRGGYRGDGAYGRGPGTRSVTTPTASRAVRRRDGPRGPPTRRGPARHSSLRLLPPPPRPWKGTTVPPVPPHETRYGPAADTPERQRPAQLGVRWRGGR